MDASLDRAAFRRRSCNFAALFSSTGPHRHVTVSVAHPCLCTDGGACAIRMAGALNQLAISPGHLGLLLTLSGVLLVPASHALASCSGHFVIEDSTIKLFVQQHINSSEVAVQCRYTFEASRKSGLLIIANDIRAVNDGEIPGCPVSIYANDEAYGDPLYSLCGHYTTVTVPVPSPSSLVVYKPVFRGTAYTLTLDLQVASTGGSTLRACGDSHLNAVSVVPIRCSLGFRADSHDAPGFCNVYVNVRSTTALEILGIDCVLTSDAVCSYDVLLNNGSTAPSKHHVDLAAGGGSATIRLHPAGISGVLIIKVPAGFEPVTFLEPPPPSIFSVESVPNATKFGVDSGVNETDVVHTVIASDVAPGTDLRFENAFKRFAIA
ncbi:hypothetical protein HPB50_023620 [Hyalomma asiaticum]|uniref:Uncharacterized protein n=1 Tax=Hyalomma asiaticum TaxID=266040 RepID=A0ACB7TAC3_HYAAI|nr:hypothetical protein HPB50_023620 [Hyalomma asiaticum]